MKQIEGKARRVHVDVKLHLFWIAVCVAALVFFYFNRDQMTADAMFKATLAFAVPGGILLGVLLHRFD